MRTKGEGDGFQCREGMTLPVTLLDLLPLQGATSLSLPAAVAAITAAADQKGGRAADISLIVPLL